MPKERLERSLVRLGVDVAYKNEAIKRVRRARRCPSPLTRFVVVNQFSDRVLERVRLHLSVGVGLRACHLVHEGLLVEQVFLVEGIPARLGDGSEPVLACLFHDLRGVLVIGGARYVAPFPRPRTKKCLCVHYGRKGDEGIAFTFRNIAGFVEVVRREGDILDAEGA